MILYWQNSRDPTWASHAYELLETLLTFPVYRHAKTWIEKVSYCLGDQATSSTCSLGDRKSPDSRRATLCVLWLKKILVMCIWYYMIVYVHLGQNLLYSPWSSISSWKFEKIKSLLMGGRRMPSGLPNDHGTALVPHTSSDPPAGCRDSAVPASTDCLAAQLGSISSDPCGTWHSTSFIIILH